MLRRENSGSVADGFLGAGGVLLGLLVGHVNCGLGVIMDDQR